MPRSDLERLAESIRAFAGQVERDIPSLQERQRHITQLAARAARLAGPADTALIRVVHLARLAADRLTDAVTHLAATAETGHDYADDLVHRPGGGPASAAGSPAPGQGAGGPGRPRRRSAPDKFEEARKLLMSELDDVGDVAAQIAEPVIGPPPEVRTDGVDNPVSAVLIVLTLGWEGAVQWLTRRRRRRGG
ncbi:hypothetical protein [Jiangella endophytica]|uniref:hypothetical protein n=1 Tax=Jiangella endophytica TaxID=1623398 RepID=UPI000E3488CA|nr:hypothetical protein [Jiangella endophytica]